MPDGTHDMHFAICDSATAGNTLWSNTESVTVTDGIFDVVFGSDTPLDLPNGSADSYVLTSNEYGQGTRQPAPGVTPPGSSGDMMFNDGGKLGAMPNLYYDAVNDRLGIGTSSPVTALDVDGHARLSSLTVVNTVDATNVLAPMFSLNSGQITDLTVFSGFALSNGRGGGCVLTSDVSGNGTWQPAPTGIGGSGTSNYLPKFRDSTTLTSSMVYDDGSSVGVGTETPSATLDVAAPLRGQSLRVADDISPSVAPDAPPISAVSTTVCSNLNAGLHGGQQRQRRCPGQQRHGLHRPQRRHGRWQ